jgi:hypothetical protein
MRELILFMHTSLDGYVAAATQSSGLTTAADDTADDATDDDGIFETVVPKLTNDADTLLLGRVVADELLGYWLNAEANDPSLSSGYLAYARWATGAHKAIISNTQEQLPWETASSCW